MNSAQKLKALARECGFDEVGITRPEILKTGEEAILKWVAEGRHGGMTYLENFQERRERFYGDLPGARSIIVLGVNYFNAVQQEKPSGFSGKIARYAQGLDYHKVISARLELFIQRLKEMAGEGIKFKSCVDTQPIPERFAAIQAGFGFLGKHTGLLSRRFGPWLFLSEIVTTWDLEEDKPEAGTCGTCKDCQTICPTGALDKDYRMDARLCIAYLTIEHKGVIPRELRPKIKDWIFGCDECMAVCPVGSYSKQTRWNEFAPEKGKGAWMEIAGLFEIPSHHAHEKHFARTALSRTNRKQMLRNACIVLGNSKSVDALPYLEKAMREDSPLVRLHAAWALGEIGGAGKPLLERSLAGETDPEVLEEIKAALGSL